MADINPVIETDAELAIACCMLLHGRLIATASAESLMIFGILEQSGLMVTHEGKMMKGQRILDAEVQAAAERDGRTATKI